MSNRGPPRAHRAHTGGHAEPGGSGAEAARPGRHLWEAPGRARDLWGAPPGRSREARAPQLVPVFAMLPRRYVLMMAMTAPAVSRPSSRPTWTAGTRAE